MKKLFFTVTNDLIYDQRMHRICSSLAANGYAVTLVGRRLASSPSLSQKNFTQKRLRCWFNKGKLFYAEYNTRLFFFLLFRKMDAICAIDLDTILPCLFLSGLKRVPRVYDAHELFTEMKEVITRPSIQKIWLGIERRTVPSFQYGYTVSQSIAEEFQRRYAVSYKTIRNLPLLKNLKEEAPKEQVIFYQGAVNEGRGFEYLIPAMKLIDARLVICGDGNFMQQLRVLINENDVAAKIELKGMLTPDELWQQSQKAKIAIAVPEREGLNQLLALPNKFFDYVNACLPQVTVNYPEYQQLNRQYEVALLIDDIAPRKIADAVNNLLVNNVLYERLAANCLLARQEWNWLQEEQKLLAFYQHIFKA